MRFPTVLPLLALCLIAFRADAASVAAPANAEKPVADKIAAMPLQPHRAIYDMSLSSVKNGSNVTGASGKMVFEWADACEGWAIQQNLQLHFDYAEGDPSEVASNEVTWESKDGKRYNFNLRRVSDGKESDNFRGKASVGKDGGSAVYAAPANKVTKLPEDTLFPTAHTALIIQKAEAGEKFFTRRVFDGTDEDGMDDVSAFIGPVTAKPIAASADKGLDSNPLLAAPSWPVHMAFFKLDDETGGPDYEMDLQLLANGVARSIRIDYGDFAVTGSLKAIEALPPPHC